MGYTLLTLVAALVAIYGIIKLYKDSKESNGKKSFAKRLGLTLAATYAFIGVIVFVVI